jgi:hypothetical protein
MKVAGSNEKTAPRNLSFRSSRDPNLPRRQSIWTRDTYAYRLYGRAIALW